MHFSSKILTSHFTFQVAKLNPVAADPGDAGSHGGEVEEEGGAGAGGELRETRQVCPGKFREFREQSR